MAALQGKILTEGDVTSRLTVPSAWWKLISPTSDRRDVLLRTVDGGGMFWEFRCSVRQQGPYMKPVLQSADWLKFVRYAGLKAGDMIYLETAENELRGTNFVLRARRLV